MPYYGLYIPLKAGGSGGGSSNNVNNGATNGNIQSNNLVDETQNSINDSNPIYVFRAKSEALEVLKKHRDARLREFNTEDDAVKYSQTGYEVVQTRYADGRTSTASLEKAAFRTPTKPELLEFRKLIESDNYERVKHMIWENPRYLVSSGDTPTTLKEGPRYNAMHICAISTKPKIAELILQTVSDVKFVDLLTGKKGDEKMCKGLCLNLLDYYLNIPEKARGETPLHLAVKNGAIEVIEVLTSYPECRMTKNNDGLLPKDIICSRMSNPAPELCARIDALLKERFYVPVLRSSDNTAPALIGQPFSNANPPNLDCDPLSPEMTIHAIAGPMNMEQAQSFRRRWKTPPRLGSNLPTSPVAKVPPFISPIKSYASYCSSTPRKNLSNSPSFNTKSLQRRALFNQKTHSPASEFNVQNDDNDDLNVLDQQNGNHSHDELTNDELTSPSSSLLTTPIEKNNNHQQLKTICPSTLLTKMKRDVFLTYREQEVDTSLTLQMVDKNNSTYGDIDLLESPSFRERHIKLSDTEKGLEMIGRELAKEQNIEWLEFWDFLGIFADIGSNDGLQKFENYLEQRKKVELLQNKSSVIFDDVCNALERMTMLGYNDGSGGNGENITNNSNSNTTVDINSMNSTTSMQQQQQQQLTTPYTCVEKSLQVFAKRMTKTIIQNIDNVVSINDSLLSELKRLKSLICSFKEDLRFIDIDFGKVHSRIGNLISIYLDNSQEMNTTMKSKIVLIMQSLIFTPGERREHIECVCTRVMQMLERPISQLLPENLKTEDMCLKMWLTEQRCDCQWETNLSRKTSRRNRLELYFKQNLPQGLDEKNSTKKDQNNKSLNNTDDPSANVDMGEEEDEEIFWSDFGSGTDADADGDADEDIWVTPPESPTFFERLPTFDDEDNYKLYIYGNEPTKRDVDVLNAIFHVSIDKDKFPNISRWKAALLRFPTEEIKYFPSPAIVKKVTNTTRPSPLVATPIGKEKESSNSGAPIGGTPPIVRKIQQQLQQQQQQLPNLKSKQQQQQQTPIASNQQQKRNHQHSSPLSAIQLHHQQQPLPIVKRLFMHSPLNLKQKQQQKQSSEIQPKLFNTPTNKPRGLFSKYRENLNIEMDSPSVLSGRNHDSGNGGGGGDNENLSILNVSSSSD